MGKMRTQIQYYRDAQQKIARLDNAVMEMLSGENPITPEELKALAIKHPERYGKYLGLAENLIKKDGKKNER